MMKPQRPIGYLSLCLLLSTIFAVSCGKEEGKGGRGASGPAPVTVAEAVEKTMPVEARSVGAVTAVATVEIKPQVSGAVSGAHFKEGAHVNEGDLLFTIDDRPYKNVVRQVQAALNRDYAQAQKARDEYEHSRLLAERGFITGEDLASAKVAVNVLEQSAAANRAALATAKLMLSYCEVRSPLTGVAGQILVDPGNVVAAGNQTLVVVNQLRPIQVNFSLPERMLSEVRKQMAAGPVEVRAFLEGETEPEIGKLTFLDNRVDRSTGTIGLFASFGNESERLWPGRFVDVVIVLSRIEKAVVVPSRAVQTGQQGTFVFVVKADKTVEMRLVAAGIEAGEETVLESGVTAGEMVVTDGQLRLVPGAAVEIKPGPGPQAP